MSLLTLCILEDTTLTLHNGRPGYDSLIAGLANTCGTERGPGLPLSSLVLSQLSKPVYGLLDISYKRKKVIVPPIKSPLRPLRTRESVRFAPLWQKIKANHPWDQKIKVSCSALLWPKQGRSSPLGPEKCPPLTFGTRKVSTPHPWD